MVIRSVMASDSDSMGESAWLTARDRRLLVWYCYQRGLKPLECVDEMRTAIGEKGLSLTAVRRLYSDFDAG